MVFKFNAEENTGLGYANLIRQSLIETCPSIKAVAYKFSDGSSIFRPSENMDNMFSFVARLSDLTISISPEVQLPLTVQYVVKGTFNSKDLNTDCIFVEEDVDLIHSIGDTSTTLSIIFDKNYGYKTAEENRKYLEERGTNLTNFKIISSRYCDLTVGPALIHKDLDQEVVTMEITSKSGNESKKLAESLVKISDNFRRMSEKI